MASSRRTRPRSRQRPAAPAQPTQWPDALMGIGLRAVGMTLPLVALPQTWGNYQDAKAWVLELLVAGTVVAWSLATALGGAPRDGGGSSDRALRLLRAAVVVYGVWWVATTGLSIVPGTSFFGGWSWGHGLLTLSATVLLFWLVPAACRTPRAILSLVDATLLGSVPVCLLAVAQALGWDPLPRLVDPANVALPVRGTFGQHALLGNYLVFLIPLAAARLAGALGAAREFAGAGHPRRRPWASLLMGAAWIGGALGIFALAPRWPVGWWLLIPWGVLGAIGWALGVDRAAIVPAGRLAVALFGTLLAGQVVILILSGARGAFLAVVAGLSVTVGVLLVRRRAWKTLAVGGCAFAAIAAFLVVLNLPASPLGSARWMPVLNRFASLAETRPGSPGWVRLGVWRGVLLGCWRQLHGQAVIPDASPWLRSAVGYGLEAQTYTVDRLARPFIGPQGFLEEGQPVRYIVDRAHNDVLDHLVTGGLVGAGLWLLILGWILVLGALRIRTSGSADEVGIRAACLGAIVAHVVEAQLGVQTPTSRALFWIVAAILTQSPWSDVAPPRADRLTTPGARPVRLALPLAVMLLAALVAWGSTRWLLGSIAYDRGTVHAFAGDATAARQAFREAYELAPWLLVTAQAQATYDLTVARFERDPVRRAMLLDDAERVLADIRRYAADEAMPWPLVGQIALAQARSGDRGKLAVARAAFETAARRHPGSATIRAQWALAWFESGDPGRARQIAEQAIALDQRNWLPWAVLGRAAAQLGDAAAARDAAERARARAPPGAHAILDAWIP